MHLRSSWNPSPWPPEKEYDLTYSFKSHICTFCAVVSPGYYTMFSSILLEFAKVVILYMLFGQITDSHTNNVQIPCARLTMMNSYLK